MPSYMSKVFKYLFGKQERNIIFLGLDASGKTSILCKLSLGTVVTDVPTIGFVVETVQYKTLKFTAWDVGTCAKIKPLWVHYFRGMDAVVFTVDSNDRDRIGEARDELHYMVKESWEHTGGKYAPVLVFATKQDLPGAMNVAEIQHCLALDGFPNTYRVVRCNGITGEGLYEGLDWLSASLSAAENSGNTSPTSCSRLVNPSDSEARKQRAAYRLEEWLGEQDGPDDEFLAAVENFTLERWDHKVHLRLAWLLLTQLGRQQGKARLFHLIQDFIQHSTVTKRASGTSYHETMTYFWMHMVHWSLATLEHPLGRGDFHSFLRQSPHLADSGLFLDYYSRKLMLETPEARRTVVLPDLRPLPSLITDVAAIPRQRLDTAAAAARKLPLSDDNFLLACESGMVSSWSHECLLRLAFVQLRTHGHRGAQRALADTLQRLQGEHYNHTIAMFWLHAVAHALVMDFGLGLFGEELMEAGGQTDEYHMRGPPTPERSSTTAYCHGKHSAERPLVKQGSAEPQQLDAARFKPDFASKGVSNDAACRSRVLEDHSKSGHLMSPFAGLSIWALATGPPNVMMAAASRAGWNTTSANGTVGQQRPPRLLSPVTWYTALTSGRAGAAELQRLSHRPMEFLSHYSEARVYSATAKCEVVQADLQPLPACAGLPPLTYLRLEAASLHNLESSAVELLPADVATSVLSMTHSFNLDDGGTGAAPSTPTAAALQSALPAAASSALAVV